MASTKLLGSLFKTMYKLNKQKINEELRPNDFSKRVSITQKNKTEDTLCSAIWIFQPIFAKRA